MFDSNIGLQNQVDMLNREFHKLGTQHFELVEKFGLLLDTLGYEEKKVVFVKKEKAGR